MKLEILHSVRPGIRILNHNQTIANQNQRVLWPTGGKDLNHNQTIIRQPGLAFNHNQTVVIAPTVKPQHNQTLVRR